MGAAQVQRFLAPAQDFLEGMQLLREEEAYRNSSALLGIHAAVSYTDALRVGLDDATLAADNHQLAVTALRTILVAKGDRDDKGLRHLESLLSKKNAIAYGDRRLSGSEFELIFTQAERFAKWADGTGRRLHLEGWIHAD